MRIMRNRSEVLQPTRSTSANAPAATAVNSTLAPSTTAPSRQRRGVAGVGTVVRRRRVAPVG
eukprot:scaffold29905_cov64-Phaeocystis_antarctica.AAC.3